MERVTKLNFHGRKIIPPHPTIMNCVLTDCTKSLQRRMLNEQDVIQEYNDIIEDSKGIVEKLPSEEINTRAEGVPYLLHYAVIRRDRETTKLRIVYHGWLSHPTVITL